MHSLREDVTSPVCSSERRAAVLVVVRRVVLLVSFLLSGLAVAAFWSATASAAETGVADAPPAHNQLEAVGAPLTDTVTPVGIDVVGDVQELVDIAKAVDQVDEMPLVSRMIMGMADAMSVDVVDGVESVTDVVRGARGGLITTIDTAAPQRAARGTLLGSPLRGEAEGAVADDGWLLTDVVLPTVESGPRVFGVVTPIVSSGSVHPEAGGPAPAGDQFPTAPFSAQGTGGGASGGASSAPGAGAVVPWIARHDDVFVVSGIAAECVYRVRQLANVPQVSPA